MRLTELETFVLHDLSTRQVKGEIKDDQLIVYLSPFGVGGYHKFAYIDGRRYELRGLSSKFRNILYLCQRTGLLKMDPDKTIQVTLPEGILPEPASRDVWVGDITGVIDAFKKDVTADDFPTKFLSTKDIKHLVESYPVTPAIREAFGAVAATVEEINALRNEENAIRQVIDLMGRDVSSISSSWQLRERFVLELSEPALKAAARQLQKDYAAAEPMDFDKMKKQKQMKCGWNEASAKYIDRLVAAAEAGTVGGSERLTLSNNLTAKAAHAAWRIEAARRHPDHGGSAEASAVFGALWSRVEKLFPTELAEVASPERVLR